MSYPLNFDPRRVDNQVVYSELMQEALDPKAISSGVVARDYCGDPGEIEPLLHSSDLSEDVVLVASGHRNKTKLLTTRGSRGNLPLISGELEREIEHRTGGSDRMEAVTRCQW